MEDGGARETSHTPVRAGEEPAAGGPAAGTSAHPGSDPTEGRISRLRRCDGPTARRVGIALLVVGLLGAGGTLGWVVRGWVAHPELRVDEPVIDRPVVVAELAEGADGAPNVLGLAESDARQAFGNMGIGGDELRVEQVPAAGQAGLVVGQRPEPGAPLEATATLLVSVTAAVPEVVGLSEADARTTLADLGARVVVERVFHDTATEGTVLAVTPAEGETLVDTATLQVVGPPSSVFVAELVPIESGCGTVDSGTIDATGVGPSLDCQPSADQPTVAEYLLNRNVAFFEATVGLDDRTEEPTPAVVRVFVDDALAHEQRAELGAAAPVRVAVAGALRLRIEVTAVDVPAECCPERPRVLLGDARLVGGPDAIDALVAESGQ